jgi:hypothetical protein
MTKTKIKVNHCFAKKKNAIVNKWILMVVVVFVAGIGTIRLKTYISLMEDSLFGHLATLKNK